MSATINKNRYRIILLLYLVFICLSLLSVPKSLLESNLYMIRTLTFQDSLLQQQLLYLDDSANRAEQSTARARRSNRDKTRGDTLVFLLNQVRAVYGYADSIDRSLQRYFKNENSSIEKEYSKKRITSTFLKKDSLLERFEQKLFSLAQLFNDADRVLGREFTQQLPVQALIVSRTKKEYSWQKYFFLDKPASVAYMHLKRIKLLLLQVGLQVAEKRIVNGKAAALRATAISVGKLQETAPDSSQLQIDSLAQFAVSIPEQLQFEIFNSIRLERFYVGLPMAVLSATDKIKLNELEVNITPAARLITSADKIQLLFSTPGQYQLSVFYKTENGRKPILQRKVNADRLPDPLVRINLEGNTRNLIRSEDLSRVNSLVASIPAVGLPPVMLRVNGFRGTIVGAEAQSSSVYNYGQVFQESMKQLINSLKQGDLLLLDNITVAVGDGSTRSAPSILYKIVN